MARRHPDDPVLPEPAWEATGTQGSAMAALDRWFVELVRANPRLRVRIGNPDGNSPATRWAARWHY